MSQLTDYSGSWASLTRSVLRQLAVLSVAVVVAVTIFVGVGTVGTASAADVTECTTINSSGTYDLTTDIKNSSKSACITITSSDVIFDGNGHIINGDTDPTAPGSSEENVTVGIKIANETTDLSNVTVRNVIATDWSIAVSAGPANDSFESTVTDSLIANVTANRTHSGIVFNGTTKATATGNEISQSSTGLVVKNSVDTVTLTNNSIRGTERGGDSESDLGIFVSAEDASEVAKSIEITDNTLTGTFTGLGGIIGLAVFSDAQNSTLQSVHIANNTIDEQSSFDTLTRGVSLYATNQTTGTKATIEDITIVDNSITGLPSDGIGIGGFGSGHSTIHNVSVISNDITDSWTGIYASSWNTSTTSKINISKNQIDQTGHDGILIESYNRGRIEDVTIRKNDLTEVKAGVAVSANDNATTKDTYVGQIDVTRSQFGYFTDARDESLVSTLTLEQSTVTNTSDSGISLNSDSRATLQSVVIRNASVSNSSGGIDAYNTSSDWTIKNSTLRNNVDGTVNADKSNGNWTIQNTTLSNSPSGSGVSTTNSTGAWQIRDSRIVNHNGTGIATERSSGDWIVANTTIANNSAEGVFADFASGDWTIKNSTLHNNTDENVDVDPSSGNWSIRNTRLSNSSVGVFAENSTGSWQIQDSRIVSHNSRGIGAQRSSGDWKVANTIIANTSGEGVFADFASGDWTIKNSTLHNNTENVDVDPSSGNWSIRNTRLSNGSVGVFAENSTGSWQIQESSIVNHTSDDFDVGINADYSTGDWSISGTSIENNDAGVVAVNSTGDWVIKNSTISNGTEGVLVRNSTGTWHIRDSSIVNNSDGAGINADRTTGNWSVSTTTIADNEAGVVARKTTGYWRIQNSTLSGNENQGITAFEAAIRGDATYNYWGAPDGPGGRYGGSGDRVVGNVRVSPFYEDSDLSSLVMRALGAVRFTDETVSNGTETVTVDAASYTLANGSAGEYVVVVHVVRQNGTISSPVGTSTDLTGSASNVTVDLNASGVQGNLDALTSNVTLRAMLHEQSASSAFGSALMINGSTVTDDANVTVTSQLFTSALPGSGGQGPPTNLDTDPQLEDVNGDGQGTFDDAIALAFAQTGNLNQRQIDALDHDGDGDVDFDDAIDLAFDAAIV